jgi:hypothetical protein
MMPVPSGAREEREWALVNAGTNAGACASSVAIGAVDLVATRT